MSPTSHCYFDYKYRAIDTRKAYAFEPVPQQLEGERARYVLGPQANFWSHIDCEPERVDRQLFPRLLAIAERGWSPKDSRDWEDFRKRLRKHYAHLDRMSISYRRPSVGHWTPARTSETYAPLTWDVTSEITDNGTYVVHLLYTHGAHRLGIEKVTLLADGVPVAADEHRGETGARHIENRYRVTLKQYGPGACYEVRASARSEGGTDSNGEVYLSRASPLD